MAQQMKFETLFDRFSRWPMNFSYYEANHYRELPIVKDSFRRIVQSGTETNEYVKDFMTTINHQRTKMKTQFRHVRQIQPYLLINILLSSNITTVIIPKQISRSTAHCKIRFPFIFL